MGADIPRVLAVVVARGGSKGVPRKNLRQIDGLSLVGYKIRAALRSGCCQRVVLSSDDAEILEEGRRQGADIPFRRPAELASDTATSDAVLLHAMDFVEAEEGGPYDAVMLLEPSSPFATPRHLADAVDLWRRRDADLVVGMYRVSPHPIFCGPLGEDGHADRIVEQFSDLSSTRRQDLEPAYTMNGAVFVVSWQAMRRTGRIYGSPAATYGLVMDAAHSCEIDHPDDLAYAEFLVARGTLDTTPWRG